MKMDTTTIVMAASGLLVVLACLAYFTSRDEAVKTVGTSAPVATACAELNIKIDRSNSVHGLKDGILFSYIDLNAFAPSLACHPNAAITEHLLLLVTAEVAKWWEEPRLAEADTAEVHIINILDKDEYARADFDSAIAYGVVRFRKGAAGASFESHDLAFK